MKAKNLGQLITKRWRIVKDFLFQASETPTNSGLTDRILWRFRNFFLPSSPLIKRTWFGATLRCHNNVMGRCLYFDLFEVEFQRIVADLLKPGMVVIDIGANVGIYTLLAAKRVGKKGAVVAFEPSPRDRKILQENVFLNQCTNVTIKESALGATDGRAKLYVCDWETGCNSLRPPNVSEPTHSTVVQLQTLDGYLDSGEAEGDVDFIKIDVEGAELEVLRGAERLLTSRGNRPIILCELADVRTEPWGYKSVEIYDHIATREYRWFCIDPSGGLRVCPRRDTFHENLLAVPVERLDAIELLIRGATPG